MIGLWIALALLLAGCATTSAAPPFYACFPKDSNLGPLLWCRPLHAEPPTIQAPPPSAPKGDPV